MDNYLKIIIGLIVFVVAMGAFFFIKDVNFGPAQSNLEECKPILTGGKAGTSVVMFTDKKNAEKYANFILNTTPYKENKEYFNLYYIDTYTPNCTLYKDIALFCDSKELRKKAASCPDDYIIVFDSKNSNIRSSAYMNIMSINKNHPISVIIHEFGHAFGNLEEEYINGDVGSKKMNCLASCEGFEGKSDGCYNGCSENELYRSIESGVMKTLTSNIYGKYDSYLLLNKIKKISGSPITGNQISEEQTCAGNFFYLVEANILDGKVSIVNIVPKEGCFLQSGYSASGQDYINWTIGQKQGTISPYKIYTDEQNIETQQQISVSGISNNYQGPFYFKVPETYIDNELVLKNANGEEIARSKIHNLEEVPCEA